MHNRGRRRRPPHSGFHHLHTSTKAPETPDFAKQLKSRSNDAWEEYRKRRQLGEALKSQQSVVDASAGGLAAWRAARQQRLGEQPLPDKASSLRAAAALLQARNESRWNTILPPTQDASTTAAERFQAFQQKRQRAKAARERAKAEAARHAAIEEPAPLEAQAPSAGVVVKSPELKLSQPLEGLRSPATLGALKPRPPSRGELGSPSRPQSRGARPKSREKGVLSGVLGEVTRPGSRAAPPGAADLLGRCSPIPLPSKPPARVLLAIKREP